MPRALHSTSACWASPSSLRCCCSQSSAARLPTGSTSAASLLEGLRFLRGHSVVMSVFGIDLLAMVFGMPRALFPALAERLGGGPTLYGLLVSSVAAGAFIASLGSGWTARVRRPGRAVLL